MGNNLQANSNQSYLCLDIFSCTRSPKNISESIHISKQTTSFHNPMLNPLIILPRKTSTAYSPLIKSQSFHYKDAPFFKSFEQNGGSFPLIYKLYSDNYHLNEQNYQTIYTTKNSSELEKKNQVDEKLIAILSNSIYKMVNEQQFGKKILKIALQGTLNSLEMDYISQSIIKAWPFNFLKIDFKSMGLKDPEILILSYSLEHLQDLEGLELLLQNNYITYIAGKALIKRLEKIKNLKTFSINLSYNFELSGNALEELAEEIGNLTLLEHLYLELQAVKLNTSDLFFIELINSLNQCKILSILHVNLSDNMLNSNLLNFFLNGLKPITRKLVELHLIFNRNPITAEVFYELSKLLEESINIKELSLGFKDCQLQTEALEVILIVLSKIPGITNLALDFSNNIFKASEARFLVDYINPENSFPEINKFILDLSNCIFDSVAFENVAFGLHCMKKAKILSLLCQKTQFKKKGLEQIICALANFTRLFEFKLNLNDSDVIFETLEILMIGLQHIKSLREVYLDLTKVKKFKIKQIKGLCKVFGKMVWLQGVFVWISGKTKKKCIEGLGRLVRNRCRALAFGKKWRTGKEEVRREVMKCYLSDSMILGSKR